MDVKASDSRVSETKERPYSWLDSIRGKRMQFFIFFVGFTTKGAFMGKPSQKGEINNPHHQMEVLDEKFKDFKKNVLYFLFVYIISFLQSQLQRGGKYRCLKMNFLVLNNSFYSIKEYLL